MTTTAIAHTYKYSFASEYAPQFEGSGKGRLALATDSSVLQKTPKKTPSGTFFSGTLLRPKRTADLLRAVSEIVTARFNNPNWRRLADPVITVGDDRMRFEGFSGCCSAYARLDLLPDAVEGDRPRRGTTNVDFNPAMISALASLRDNDYVALNIGAEEISISKNAEKTVERKVSLPVRWLKSFVEIQAYQAAWPRCRGSIAVQQRRQSQEAHQPDRAESPRRTTSGRYCIVPSTLTFREGTLRQRHRELR